MDIQTPLNLASQEFTERKYEIYPQLLEEHPVAPMKYSIIKGIMVTRYDDCRLVLKDPRFVRNRTTATGKGNRFPFPIPLPKSVQAMSQSMILEDEPAHRRLRNLVHKAFTPHSLIRIQDRIESLTDELLNKMETETTVDLMKVYSLPIPVTVIREMVGIDEEDMPQFQNVMSALSKGLTGWRLLKTFLWDMPKSIRFIRELIERKRKEPKDDIFTALIHAEEDGDQLSEDELISMLFLIIVAGYETTVHLITNAVLTLLQHPEDLARVRAEPEMMEGAVEEILRYRGPIHGTKPIYPTEDVTLHGVTIPKGTMVFPLLGAANFDPRKFEDPQKFDITRSPNQHLAFGYGIHFCLGAPLARMETQIALKNLLDRFPNLQLAVKPEELKLQRIPMWHRYQSLPVKLR